MSLKTNIEIPARLEFRPYPVSWLCCSGEVIGWSDKQSTSDESLAFTWPLVAEGQRSRSVVKADSILLNVRFLDSSLTDNSTIVAVQNSVLPRDVLKLGENRRNAPDISGRTFSVLVCAMEARTRDIFYAYPSAGPERDPWQMWDEFWDLDQDPGSLCGFLNKWGLWDRDEGYESEAQLWSRPGFLLLFPHRVWNTQSEYVKALTGAPDRWLSSSCALDLRHSKERPYFKVKKSYCDDALRAIITIKHLSAARFRICQRTDCRKLFEMTTSQNRKYHSHGCAHVAAMRALRARQKREQKGGRNNATRKDPR